MTKMGFKLDFEKDDKSTYFMVTDKYSETIYHDLFLFRKSGKFLMMDILKKQECDIFGVDEV